MPRSPSAGVEADLDAEQRYVSGLYGRLDELRGLAARRLATALRQTGGTPQARSERESAIALHTERLAQLRGVEQGLCFGRLDLDGGRHRYVGRIGLLAEDGADEPLLVDWRAPAARPFYLATAAAPDGVLRRRHLRTRGRTVVGLDDEVLDLDAARETRHTGLASEAALLAAVTAGRTGRMRDIVETIQGEQDRIIRAPMDGVLVVQGGPGTGKTAVALHRAAYLLYTHRRRLATAGVLVVGPNGTFLRYISQVLPTLAETGVLLRTPGDLFPGVSARRAEPAAVAALKGRPEFVGIIAAAVADRQEAPAEGVRFEFDRDTFTVGGPAVAAAREAARASARPHNEARAVFARHLHAAMARAVADRIGHDPYGEENLLEPADVDDIARELSTEPAALAVADRLWPHLSPQRLLTDLFADADRLARSAPGLPGAERDLLRRPPGGGWTPADVPLLDEAAELLGEDDSQTRWAELARRQREIEYAEGALEIAMGSRSIDLEDEADPELLTAVDLLAADRLAERQEDGERLTAAERAAADRRWAYGHVIVDEAQELSPMAWRLLMRRCPSRSMTVVGDVAQTGDAAGTSSWAAVLSPYVADRWRRAELTVSYRTPGEILDVAAGVLAGVGPGLTVPRAVRESGERPWAVRVPPERLGAELVALVRAEADGAVGGRVGVIVPPARLPELGAAVAAAVPGTGLGDEPDLERRTVVLTVAQVKGLEFDAVLVVEPAEIVAGTPRGHSDLYVALTRATRRLGVLHAGELPGVLAGALAVRQPRPA